MIAGGETIPASGVILAVDVGNTTTSVGIVEGQKVRDRKDVATEPLAELLRTIRSAWQGLSGGNHRIVCGSVVPHVLSQLRTFCRDTLQDKLIVIGQDIGFAIPLDVENPKTVGVDRVCAATAAYGQLRKACIVADFGTAITIDLVSEEGVFLGGTIAPGIELSARILHEATATLPLVGVQAPRGTVGKNTESAMNNGIFLMAVGGLREIVERMAAEVGHWPSLVLTGGGAQAVAEACNFVDHVVPDLCLLGIAWTYKAHEQENQS